MSASKKALQLFFFVVTETYKGSYDPRLKEVAEQAIAIAALNQTRDRGEIQTRAMTREPPMDWDRGRARPVRQ